MLSGCGGGEVASPGTVAAPVVPASPVVTTPPATTVPTPTVLPSDLVASPRPASRSANDSAEYRSNYNSYELVGALYAADAGITGKGVTVGIVDGG
ncbi:MAG: hypothetical protein ACRYG4_06190, partial [Janthinobacterium lividum]